ncbi:CST complex subunit TEN1 [Aristolochia californica]|uniref:CST complex subunit TEN1 n=1 Tax=Aristolochia californica TaxID=171875 RepID=UPI0035DD6A4E
MCFGSMAASMVKPGIPVALRELDSFSPLFKEGTSLRVTGKLLEHDEHTSVAVIVDENVNLKIDTQHLRDLNLRVGSMYQFIGELHIHLDTDATLHARVGRNVDGIDLNLYYQTLQLRRRFEAEIRRRQATDFGG